MKIRKVFHVQYPAGQQKWEGEQMKMEHSICRPVAATWQSQFSPQLSSLHRKSQTNKKLVRAKVVAAATEWEKNRKQRWKGQKKERKKSFSLMS